jgi:carbonic anhydrase
MTDAKSDGALKFQYREFVSRAMPDEKGYKFDVEVHPPAAGGGIMIGNTSYELKSFHVHTKSEHTFGGAQAAFEVHLVHESATGLTAVVGILMDEVASGGNGLVTDMMTNAMEKAIKDFKVNPNRFLSRSGTRYYSYKGSLTTPGCSPVAYWMVDASPKGGRPTVNRGDLENLKTFILGFSINHATHSTYPYNDRPVPIDQPPVNVTVYNSQVIIP